MQTTRILGLDFYSGSLDALLEVVAENPGVLVAPSGPNLADLPFLDAYRDALLAADYRLLDSGYLVLLWRIFTGQRLERISGLRFLQAFLDNVAEGPVFWVMPSEDDADTNLLWLYARGIEVDPASCYIAPQYSVNDLRDEMLLQHIREQQPPVIIINIGGGIQEVLGAWLKSQIDFPCLIICTGAALAFMSGRQVKIPEWADRIFMGWFFRCLHKPLVFVPRYWKALRLARWVYRYKSELPRVSVAG
jgi:UDP-N-acetyl-D-mannosaminuronic acid transferase (WecB/TagA/CpsF family)